MLGEVSRLKADINPIVVLSRIDEIEGDPVDVRKALAGELFIPENSIFLLENYHSQVRLAVIHQCLT